MMLWLSAALSLGYVVVASQTAVKVSVFYESLCPDSIRFIDEQLYPTWTNLTEKYLSVDFIPYGKASHRSADGRWSFSCQHGDTECRGNEVQACALRQLRNSSSQRVEFVHCAMADGYPPAAGPKCANNLNISYDPIEECSNGQEGETLLAEMGDRTHEFRPKIAFIPTIAVYGVYSEEDQRDSLTNFLAVVCRYISGDKPAACRPGK
ncbi:GILT-like protein 1 isoform X2 [Bacillus rossius redtenbacheri]|uniref:GILT-like protein 1 isoform X2 n=1 Tax=Bacillus rossius redtenbacheri TaxID=93214 RepID=UPI002FDEBC89